MLSKLVQLEEIDSILFYRDEIPEKLINPVVPKRVPKAIKEEKMASPKRKRPKGLKRQKNVNLGSESKYQKPEPKV